MNNSADFYFGDHYRLTVKEGYLENHWRGIKEACNSSLMEYRPAFCAEALGDFRDEFMKEADFWCKDIFFAIMEKYQVRYAEATRWLGSREEEFVFQGVLWKEMAAEYPVLNRIIGELTKDFTEHIKDLTALLFLHRQEIADTFFQGTPGIVTHVGAGVSDYHCGHRSVHIITYDHGGKVVYKPRSMQMDLAWNTFLEGVSGHMGEDFYVPRILDCGEYGFSSYIQSCPVSCVQEIRMYFKRMGCLSGLIYILGGRDFHYENVIAHGAFPVLVDTETTVSAEEEGKEIFHLLNSCMYPWLRKDKGYHGGYDSMTTYRAGGRNLPHWEGKCQSGRNNRQEVQEGFEQAYRLLMELDSQARRKLMEAFSGCRVRRIKRSTSFYSDVLRLLRTRKCLKSEEAFTDGLNEVAECSPKEREILYHLQIPIFSCPVDTDRLVLRLNKLGQEDLAQRKKDIAFYLADIRADDGKDSFIWPVCQDSPADCERMIEETAHRVLTYWNDRIRENLRTDTGGKVLVVERDNLCYYEAGMNCYFFESIPGWLIVNLCWSHLTDRTEQEQLYQMYLDKLEKQMEETPASVMERGFPEGAGGLIYVLSALYKTGGISRAGQVCENVLKQVLQSEPVKNKWNTSWLYGDRGLLWGLYTLPEELKTSHIRARIGFMEQTLGVFGLPAFRDICHPPAPSDWLCQNDSLLCGNAGVLYDLADRCRRQGNQTYRHQGKAIAAVMAGRMNQKGVSPVLQEDRRCISFLYGEGGVLYSFRRIMDDAALPVLFHTIL